jgi:ribosomal protein S18 acetylase RimI-like enzyme
MNIREFQRADGVAVISLWHQCGLVVPHNDPALDIERKLAVSGDLFLVGESQREIVASVMGGYDGHRGWINYLAVHPDHQQLGYGRSIMAAVEARICAKGCPKINLQVRRTNAEVIRFYESLGYSLDDVIGMGKRILDSAPE